MKSNLSRTEAQKTIEKFFSRRRFTALEAKKIKRLAMKYNIKLGSKRKFFCKKCLSQLKGRISISKTHKTVICKSCSYKNKFKLMLS